MMKMDFRSKLQQQSLMIADGGMSTSLYDKGFYINRSFEELSLNSPQVVKEVSIAFKNAGADILTTNTFNAIEPKLTEYGLQDQLEEILLASMQIAREVAGNEQYVLASMGPLGLVLEPLGPVSIEQAKAYFKRNVTVFAKGDIDGIILEGFHDLNELTAAIQAVKEHSQLPIVACIGIQESLKTSYGHKLEEFAQRCEIEQVEALGLTGEVGPSGMLTALEKLRPLTEKPIAVMPNAGLPRYVNDQYIYLCNPDYMGKYAKRFSLAGADIIGGHCGVTEHHIRAIRNAVRMTQNSRRALKGHISHILPEVDEPKTETPIVERSRLGERLHNKEMVVSVELVPPKGVNFSVFVEQCHALEQAGVEFVNIPDGARAVARMSSLQLSTYLKNHLHLEPIPHFTARDRNLIGIQSDLLGAHANGVRNVLLVTGDPPKLGNCPGATAVYDVDAIGLTHIASRMNKGLDLGGSSFGQPTDFLIGVALNPTATNRELEIERFRYKIEAGANFAMTQPIYSLDSYQQFFEELGPIDIPIIMGIWPLISLRNAEFLKNEVPGVDVPHWVINEMEKAGTDKDEALKRGLEIAINTMSQAKSWVSGFQVSAPFNRVNVALDAIRLALNP